MKKGDIIAGLLGIALAIGAYFGAQKQDFVEFLCSGECNTTVEKNVTADCKPCPEPEPCPKCPEPEPCPTLDLQPTYDSNFSGRIVYEDGSPYKRGVVRALGDNWLSYALTDDKGAFTVSVKGKQPFQFSAYSPFGDKVFYHYKKKIMVPEDTNGSRKFCTDGNTTLEICADRPFSNIKRSEWRVGYARKGARVKIEDGKITISKGGKYSYAKKPYKYEAGKMYHFKVNVKTVPANKRWCVAADSNHGYCSTKQGVVEFNLKAKKTDKYIGLFGYGDYDVIFTDVEVRKK